MMLRPLRELHWDDPTEYLPAFLVLVGIPLTFSIADGIALGLISYAVAKLATAGPCARHSLCFRRVVRGAILILYGLITL